MAELEKEGPKGVIDSLPPFSLALSLPPPSPSLSAGRNNDFLRSKADGDSATFVGGNLSLFEEGTPAHVAMGGMGGIPLPLAPISYLATYELFEILIYCVPPQALNSRPCMNTGLVNLSPELPVEDNDPFAPFSFRQNCHWIAGHATKSHEKSLKIFRPIVPAEIVGTESFLDYTRLHVGSLPAGDALRPPSAPDFKGHVQQLTFNGVPYIEKVRPCGKAKVVRKVEFDWLFSCRFAAASTRTTP